MVETMSKWEIEGSFLTWQKISKKVSKESVIGHCENFNTLWNGNKTFLFDILLEALSTTTIRIIK